MIEARDEGLSVAHVHISYLSPMPRNLETLLSTFGRVVVPEMNNGQLVKVLRAEYLIPAEGMTKVNGKPFLVTELLARIRDELENR